MNTRIKEYKMIPHTLNGLVEEAMARAVNARAIAVAKKNEEARAAAILEEKFKADQVKFLSQLLPDQTFRELGLDLARLQKQAKNNYNYHVTGECVFTNQDNQYRAGVSIIASYPSSNKENNEPNTVYLRIEDKSVKLYLPNQPSQYRELNLIALGQVLRQVVDDASAKRKKEYQERKRRVRRSLDDEHLTSEKCQSFIDKLQKCTWPLHS